MIAINYSELRKSLKKNLDLACSSHETIVVQRSNDKSVVLVSLEEYNSLIETTHLLSTRANVARLTKAIKEADDVNDLKNFDPTL